MKWMMRNEYNFYISELVSNVFTYFPIFYLESDNGIIIWQWLTCTNGEMRCKHTNDANSKTHTQMQQKNYAIKGCDHRQ